MIGYPRGQDVWVIDQARGQDGWILAKFFFCVFMDRDEVEVHKHVKKERGQYLVILTEQAWSIKDLLYRIKVTVEVSLEQLQMPGHFHLDHLFYMCQNLLHREIQWQ